MAAIGPFADLANTISPQSTINSKWQYSQTLQEFQVCACVCVGEREFVCEFQVYVCVFEFEVAILIDIARVSGVCVCVRERESSCVSFMAILTDIARVSGVCVSMCVCVCGREFVCEFQVCVCVLIRSGNNRRYWKSFRCVREYVCLCV